MRGLHECEQISPTNDSTTGGSSFLHLRRNSYRENFHSAKVFFQIHFSTTPICVMLLKFLTMHARNLTYSEGNISLFYSAKANGGKKYKDLRENSEPKRSITLYKSVINFLNKILTDLDYPLYIEKLKSIVFAMIFF